MGKRKHSYLIYKDGKKERIFNWLNVNPCNAVKRILAFTQNGIYLYVDINKEIIPEVQPIRNYPIVKHSSAFYKLKGGVHDIDTDNVDIWYSIYDIDRMEIVMDLN